MSKKFARPAFVLGVGMSAYGNPGENPELDNMTERELLAWACQEAYDDAGIRARDVEKIVYGQVAVWYQGQAFAGLAPIPAWTGCEGKPFSHHDEACATGYHVIGEAVEAVASGKYDIVLACAQETPNTFYKSTDLPFNTYPAVEYLLGEDGGKPWMRNADFGMLDSAYHRWDGAMMGGGMEAGGMYYMDEYGKSLNEVDDYLNAICYNQRYNASHNPSAAFRESYDDIAKKLGFANAMEYLKSDHNPLVSKFVRRAGLLKHVTGAGACIICSEDVAKSAKSRAIQVLGTGFSTIPFHVANSYKKMNKYVAESAYEQSGVKPEEIEYLQCTDMTSTEVLHSVEDMGYLPAGEGWKYHMENRTTFEGDKPINTNGGSQNNGHVLGATGLTALTEVVLQMRGEAGQRQIKKAPHTTMMRGHGGSHTTAAFIFRNQE